MFRSSLSKYMRSRRISECSLQEMESYLQDNSEEKFSTPEIVAILRVLENENEVMYRDGVICLI